VGYGSVQYYRYVSAAVRKRAFSDILCDGTISGARRRLEFLGYVGGGSCGHIGVSWYGAAICAPNGAEFFASEDKDVLFVRVET
jgi:hypothetical protein